MLLTIGVTATLCSLTYTPQKMRKPRKCHVCTSFAAVNCVLVLAACGPSQKTSDATAAVAHSKGIPFANCMRAHGVPSFPDPSGGGGGINLDRTGINPNSPAFKSAQQACAHLTPAGAPGGMKATESQFVTAVRFAKCMRAHGYSDFPDPTRSDSPPGPILIVANGMFFRVGTAFNPNSPAFKRAATGCLHQ